MVLFVFVFVFFLWEIFGFPFRFEAVELQLTPIFLEMLESINQVQVILAGVPDVFFFFLIAFFFQRCQRFVWQFLHFGIFGFRRLVVVKDLIPQLQN